MKITDKHVLFFSYKDCLSNFYPCELVYDNHKFFCSEQLFMYLKALHFKDFKMAENILTVKTPKEAKLYGRLVRGFNLEDWLSIREDIMYTTLVVKLKQCKPFYETLKQNKDKSFIEASPYDRIWGIGLSENHKDATNKSKWKGLNLLGKTINILVKDTFK